MPRIVLLGLADGDVDVLSRLPGVDPRPEVVVAHPDPTALVLQLASLSNLITTTASPSPRADDVVVAGGGAGAAWIDAFRSVGARVLSPEDFPHGIAKDAEAEDTAEHPSEVSRTPAAGVSDPEKPPIPADEESAPLPPSVTGTPAPSTFRERIMSDSSDPKRPSRPELSIVRDQGAPSPDVWTDPETTFRYLLDRAVGPNTPATLWWDGAIEVWVPWLWTGHSPASEGKSVVRLPSAYGGFRLTGDWTEGADLPVAALTRVAEDMALRDLAGWEKTAAGLAADRDVPRGRDALRRWAAPVLRALEPETAWLWERQPDGWKLRDVAGDDVTFSGELVASEHMLESLFQGPGFRWERWRPAEHLSVHLGFSPGDGQWPLRWARVKKALTSKA
jgi:hypothetical protein